VVTSIVIMLIRVEVYLLEIQPLQHLYGLNQIVQQVQRICGDLEQYQELEVLLYG
jgi:hypothetical protein